MTREEQIAVASCAYSMKGSSIDFTTCAKWADKKTKSPWISVEDDLPCNHNELIDSEDNYLTQFVIAFVNGFVCLSRMEKIYGEWHWKTDVPTHWMPIPELPNTK